jgi:hypothetical protein
VYEALSYSFTGFGAAGGIDLGARDPKPSSLTTALLLYRSRGCGSRRPGSKRPEATRRRWGEVLWGMGVEGGGKRGGKACGGR